MHAMLAQFDVDVRAAYISTSKNITSAYRWLSYLAVRL